MSLDDADHLLSKRADAIYFANVIAAWAERYIGTGHVEGKGDDVPSIEDGIVVQETGEGKFINAVSVNGHHTLRADDPLSVGGNDSGPTPYDYLLTALGACKSMTMRMYADRKKWSMDRARVTLRHNKIHAEDCAAYETDEGKVDQFNVEIAIEGDLSDEQRQKIYEISNRCPVHQTLINETSVVSKLTD